MTSITPVRFEQGPAMLLGGLRRMHRFAEAGRTIPEQWQAVKALLPLPGQRSGTIYGVLCGGGPEGFEYGCMVEVDSLDTLPEGLGRMRITEQRYAVFVHRGSIHGIRETWQGIFAWLASSGHASAQRPDFEVYDARFDPDAETGEVEIWLSITEGAAPSDRSTP